ncbi:hypothetical protein CONLIGDRAFT_626864 [Coniochaeta ligniaria NRRL 30616]|uniref:Zn(2)-C6 fungal-type domain-containing protein n=1 Tax=Coniochaeta ligniaria NRRL 30616 TaxID=1408157 RepID=A0A1J7J615_9PEZI|nr:hypothetical protein CONLIGDRAFT_626864 [Coniochaeta ligniaria NRRL 30616]
MVHPTSKSPEAEGPKRRACDECRSRKLACTKEADGCSRCKRDGVRCHYSRQKQMGRPRKPKQQQETVQVEVVPESREPVIMPASDSSMDLDLDMAFFDMNDISFLDLMGSEYSLGLHSTPSETMPPPPKQPVRQTRSPGVWQMMSAEHLAHDINFDNDAEPQPLSQEVSLEEAAEIMSAEIPETLSLPALSPPQQSSTSSEHPSPSDHQPQICGCLASLYLALDSLQHLPQDACSAINVARTASKTAHNAITCPICSTPPLDPTDPTTHGAPMQSLQNMMMLGALLPSLSNAYKTILRAVDAEAHAANLSSRKLPFQLAAYGGLWGALATDNLCGAATDIEGRELEPAMWRLTVRALLKIDVYGISDCAPTGRGDETPAQQLPWQPGLKDIIQMMEERSRSRHEQIDRLVAEGRMRVDDGRCEYVPLDGGGTGEKPTCFRIIDIAKKSLQSLDIP